MPQNYFKGDPYWTTARFTSTCRGCKCTIKKGERIFYYPKGKVVYCKNCGQDEYEQFKEAAEAEYMVTGPLPYDDYDPADDAGERDW